jgi:hypothetical protein
MPTYIAPNYPDCRIHCSGAGGAAFIPPYTCVLWCAELEQLIVAFLNAVRQVGWEFECSLDAAWLAAIMQRFDGYAAHACAHA